ncbi:MAG TPA: hypothetical protein VFZ34_22950 [Blastocatellia bacterium]|nr:hypothetical protein [Blastocatellia bacterium]
MSEITLENVYRQAQQLPPEEQQKLIEAISARLKKKPLGQRVHPSVPYKDRSREHQWLRENSRKYIGQWVGLEGDRLLVHGTDAKEVFAAADATGVDRPLHFFVEAPDLPTFSGF